MKSKEFKNLMQTSYEMLHENGKRKHKHGDCPGCEEEEEKEKAYSDEDTGQHDIKHKGKCSTVHPDMDHEEWEMSQNEGRSFFKQNRKDALQTAQNVLAKTKELKQGQGMSDQEWKDAEIRIANREATARKEKKESLEIDEGKVSEIDARRKEGESPEQIAKGMRVGIKDVNKVLGIRKTRPLTNPMQPVESVEVDEKLTITGYDKKGKKIGGYTALGQRDADSASNTLKKHFGASKVEIKSKTDEATVGGTTSHKENIIDRPSVLDKKRTVKTKSGTKEKVSQSDLEAAGEFYDRLMKKKEKKESVDYELSDLTKETLGRFIENSLFDNDIQELKTSTHASYIKKAKDQLFLNPTPSPRKIVNRRKGINKSVDRLATRKTRMYQGGERGSEIK